ncbi:hypothetical protein EI77_04689, partial [Prosthecobacter fusiformis]
AFLTRGLEAVNAEVSLSALGYNMRRVLNIVGTGELIKHLGKRAATAA